MEHNRTRGEGLPAFEVSYVVDLAAIDALLSPEGRSLLVELAENPPALNDEIAVITRLRKTHSPALVAAAVEQAALRVRARAKFSKASEMFFTRAGLEQASSERMATHHAERYGEFSHVADLCCGVGGDLIGLASGREVVAVDVDRIHSRLSKMNADVYGVGASVIPVCADVHDLPLDGIQAVFVDPARRTANRRFGPGMSEPSIAWCSSLAERGIAVGVKAAPGLPDDLVPPNWEAEFVSEHRELKECALWSPRLATVQRRATLLPGGETLTGARPASVPVAPPGRFLIDPDPAVTRAGLVQHLAEALGPVWRIDEQVAFLSSDTPIETAFGRTLEIAASQPWSLARLKQMLRDLDVGTVDIRKRGSAVDVDEIQRRLKLTGRRAATVVLTRVANRQWTMVCFAPDASGLDLNSTSV